MRDKTGELGYGMLCFVDTFGAGWTWANADGRWSMQVVQPLIFYLLRWRWPGDGWGFPFSQ
jgi:hypothetical protein